MQSCCLSKKDFSLRPSLSSESNSKPISVASGYRDAQAICSLMHFFEQKNPLKSIACWLS